MGWAAQAAHARAPRGGGGGSEPSHGQLELPLKLPLEPPGASRSRGVAVVAELLALIYIET